MKIRQAKKIIRSHHQGRHHWGQYQRACRVMDRVYHRKWKYNAFQPAELTLTCMNVQMFNDLMMSFRLPKSLLQGEGSSNG